MPLNEALSIIYRAKDRIESIPGAKGQVFKKKMRSVLEKISALKTLDDFSKVLTGEGAQLPIGYTANEAGSLKFCPIASADVECSFSIFKNVFFRLSPIFYRGELGQNNYFELLLF